MNLNQILKNSELFRDLSDSETELVSRCMKEKTIEAGDFIVQEGTQAYSLFLVVSGSVEIVKKNALGEEPHVSELTPGTIFGEQSMLNRWKRTAGVKAHENVKLLEWEYDDLEKLATENSALGVKLYRAIAKSLTEKLKRSTEDLVSLISSARMTALGEMASGIAHEINNPLAIISLASQHIVDSAENPKVDKAAVVEKARRVAKNAKRIDSIIRGLRTLTRNAEADPMEVSSIKGIVDDTLEICRERFRSHQITLDVVLPPEDLTISCRASQIAQVLLNLLNNAHDAVVEMGEQKEKWVRLGVDKTTDGIRILITDCGNGIPEKVREKLFQSFFTTKGFGKGTGLGLSLSRKIIEGHGGTLEINTSSPNTQFVILLPKDGPKELKPHS